jgi:hypothetical protein
MVARKNGLNDKFTFNNKNPGNDLLSHGETPHYHRRTNVSLLSSRWDQVVPIGYGRQEKRFLAYININISFW